jgi:transcriptional regulator with XRE-family HTH domain
MKLETYLSETGTSQTAFAARIGTTQAAVARYAGGKRFPRPEIVARIEAATDGKVSFNDFFPRSEAAE